MGICQSRPAISGSVQDTRNSHNSLTHSNLWDASSPSSSSSTFPKPQAYGLFRRRPSESSMVTIIPEATDEDVWMENDDYQDGDNGGSISNDDDYDNGDIHNKENDAKEELEDESQVEDDDDVIEIDVDDIHMMMKEKKKHSNKKSFLSPTAATVHTSTTASSLSLSVITGASTISTTSGSAHSLVSPFDPNGNATMNKHDNHSHMIDRSCAVLVSPLSDLASPPPSLSTTTTTATTISRQAQLPTQSKSSSSSAASLSSLPCDSKNHSYYYYPCHNNNNDDNSSSNHVFNFEDDNSTEMNDIEEEDPGAPSDEEDEYQDELQRQKDCAKMIMKMEQEEERNEPGRLSILPKKNTTNKKNKKQEPSPSSSISSLPMSLLQRFSSMRSPSSTSSHHSPSLSGATNTGTNHLATTTPKSTTTNNETSLKFWTPQQVTAATAVHPHTLSHFHRLELQAKLASRAQVQKTHLQKYQDRYRDVKGYKKLWEEFQQLKRLHDKNMNNNDSDMKKQHDCEEDDDDIDKVANDNDNASRSSVDGTSQHHLNHHHHSATPKESYSRRFGSGGPLLCGGSIAGGGGGRSSASAAELLDEDNESQQHHDHSLRYAKPSTSRRPRAHSFDLHDSHNWYFDFQAVDFAYEGVSTEHEFQTSLSLLSESSMEAQRRLYAEKRRQRRQRKKQRGQGKSGGGGSCSGSIGNASAKKRNNKNQIVTTTFSTMMTMTTTTMTTPQTATANQVHPMMVRRDYGPTSRRNIHHRGVGGGGFSSNCSVHSAPVMLSTPVNLLTTTTTPLEEWVDREVNCSTGDDGCSYVSDMGETASYTSNDYRVPRRSSRASSSSFQYSQHDKLAELEAKVAALQARNVELAHSSHQQKEEALYSTGTSATSYASPTVTTATSQNHGHYQVQPPSEQKSLQSSYATLTANVAAADMKTPLVTNRVARLCRLFEQPQQPNTTTNAASNVHCGCSSCSALNIDGLVQQLHHPNSFDDTRKDSDDNNNEPSSSCSVLSDEHEQDDYHRYYYQREDSEQQQKLSVIDSKLAATASEQNQEESHRNIFVSELSLRKPNLECHHDRPCYTELMSEEAVNAAGGGAFSSSVMQGFQEQTIISDPPSSSTPANISCLAVDKDGLGTGIGVVLTPDESIDAPPPEDVLVVRQDEQQSPVVTPPSPIPLVSSSEIPALEEIETASTGSNTSEVNGDGSKIGEDLESDEALLSDCNEEDQDIFAKLLRGELDADADYDESTYFDLASAVATDSSVQMDATVPREQVKKKPVDPPGVAMLDGTPSLAIKKVQRPWLHDVAQHNGTSPVPSLLVSIAATEAPDDYCSSSDPTSIDSSDRSLMMAKRPDPADNDLMADSYSFAASANAPVGWNPSSNPTPIGSPARCASSPCSTPSQPSSARKTECLKSQSPLKNSWIAHLSTHEFLAMSSENALERLARLKHNEIEKRFDNYVDDVDSFYLSKETSGSGSAVTPGKESSGCDTHGVKQVPTEKSPSCLLMSANSSLTLASTVDKEVQQVLARYRGQLQTQDSAATVTTNSLEAQQRQDGPEDELRAASSLMTGGDNHSP